MLNLKKLLTKMLIRADVPKFLNATVVKPSATGWTPTYKTVATIADYNAIAVRVQLRVESSSSTDNRVDQFLYFPRLLGNYTQSLAWCSGSSYIRALVSVKWDTNQVGVALINGDISTYYAQIQQVIGLSHI